MPSSIKDVATLDSQVPAVPGPSTLSISTKPTYSALRSNIIRLTPESMQCKLYCRGSACKYCDPSGWPSEEQAIKGLYSSWITPNILAMSRPTQTMILQYDIMKQFKQHNVKTIINLQSLNEHAFCGPPLLPCGFSYDPETMMRHKIYYYNFEMPDFGVPNVYSLLNTIKVMHFALKQGKIAIHCHAGLGRTCTLIACYLVWVEMMTAEQAIQMVRSKRPKSIQSPRQIMLIEQLSEMMEKFAVALPLEEGLMLKNYLTTQNDFVSPEESRKFSHIPKVIYCVCDKLLNLVFEDKKRYILPSEASSLMVKHNIRECTIGKISVEWKHAYSSKGRAQTRYIVNILARISSFPFEHDNNVKAQFQSTVTVVNVDQVVQKMDASRLVHILNYYMKLIKRPYCEKAQLIAVFERFAAEQEGRTLPPDKQKHNTSDNWQCLIFYLLNVLSYLTGENYEVCSTLVAGWIYGPNCTDLKATIHHYMRDLFARNLQEQEHQSKIRDAAIAENNEKLASMGRISG